MAKCSVCEGEMRKVKGCSNHIYLLNDGTRVNPIKVGAPEDPYFSDERERCGDCNAAIGETHHIGCDVEICRLCGGQFAYCDCDYSDRIVVIQNK
ncbi:hypothetical protein WMO40_20980 [Bacillaceae bacterium CLA-AA-H227]|uniref:Uncharacterized protein n=1 Tax=Robertmurraya yapensis (ex Hitch et al 2024) TaxID=3133160 RepID=A0ACC6SGI3_9BACI